MAKTTKIKKKAASKKKKTYPIQKPITAKLSREEKETLQFTPFNNVGMAQRFLVIWMEYSVRWVVDLERFIYFDPVKQRHIIDTKNHQFVGNAMMSVGRMCKHLADELETKKDPDRGLIGNLRGLAKSSGNIPQLRNNLQALRMQEGVEIESHELDTNKYIIGTPTEIIDTRIGKPVPYNPDWLVTKNTNVGYDNSPEVLERKKDWEGHILDCSCGDETRARFIRCVFGFMSTGHRARHLYFAYGDTQNGKTTTAEAVAQCLGDYAQPLTEDLFIMSNGNNSKWEQATLGGLRAGFAEEFKEGAYWNREQVKALVGGGDKIKVRDPHGKFFYINNTAKFFISCNEKPNILNPDAAFMRRFLLIPFLAKFQGDNEKVGFRDEVKEDPTWQKGIFSWLLDGAVDYHQNGFIVPDIVTGATQEYFEGEDIIGQFIEEQCDVDPDARIHRVELHDNFKYWRKETGGHPWGEKKFYRILRKKGFKDPKKDSGKYTFLGIKLKDSDKRERFDAFSF